MKCTNAKVKKMYQDAIFQVFGIDDDDPIFEESNARLKRAIKRDVHLAKKAPGQWCPFSTLEIYCENGIPNASDVHDFGAEMREFGIEGESVAYNHDKWIQVDGLVNLLAEAYGWHERFSHEPYSDAVVTISEEPPF